MHNVIIRNLSITGATDDLINVQMFSHHIWIDHNDLSNGDDARSTSSAAPTSSPCGLQRDLGRMVVRDNILVNCHHPIEIRGTVTDPRGYYPYTVDPVATVPTAVPAGAGVGKI